jgi:2,3-bisphosphoglycerate-dependent phosphoglycerate mutase
MARLIAALVRHADYQQLVDTPSAHQPFALTADGEAQARAAAHALIAILDERSWSLAPEVDCSQLQRAWQTARLIIDALPGRLAPEMMLTEFAAMAERSVGIAANLTLKQIEAVIAGDPRYASPPTNWKSDSDYRLPLPGAESIMESGERVAAHIEQRMQQLAEGTDVDTVKLFVGHGAAFRHAAFKMGVLDRPQIARLSMHHAVPVYLEYLHGAGWRHVGGEWKPRDHIPPPPD